MNVISQSNSLVIIGAGPRGVNILERLAAFAFRGSGIPISTIYIIDPHAVGEGIHEINQPDYMLLNTVASQITMFMDHTVQNVGPILPGPNLYSWSMRFASEYLNEGPNTYLPRKIFGQYMRWCYQYLLDRLHRYCEVISISDSAESIKRESGGSFTIGLSNSPSIETSFLILTTGHAENMADDFDKHSQRFIEAHAEGNPHLKYVGPTAGNLDKQLSDISSCAKVAIQGMGLTAFDALATLTVGRGGRFTIDKHTGRKTYHPSGQEPAIILYSRSGLPLSARATNRKRDDEQYQARFLTADLIASWIRDGRQLDFEEEVLPVLIREMRHAHILAHAERDYGQRFSELLDYTLTSLSDEESESLWQRFFPSITPLKWQQFLQPVPQSARVDYATFRSWLEDWLDSDIADASEGNVANPFKAACDVLRDTRDNLRAVVDHGRLTPDSHKRFFSSFVPTMNRLSVGPPLHRMRELQALMAAGYVDMGFGPSPTCTLDRDVKAFNIQSNLVGGPSFAADVLIRAQIPKTDPLRDASPLIADLLSSGMARAFKNGSFHAGGIDVDQDQHLITQDGESLANAWALGTICEGAKFYTYIVPRPLVNSTALVDAGKVVCDLIGQAEQSNPGAAEVRVNSHDMAAEHSEFSIAAARASH